MKTSEETKENEMKYECIQAACAEAGDEVELFCLSDNKRLKFTLPSSDEIEAFGLSLYREVIGNHVTGIIHYNGKEYKVTSIIKPDVNAQHTALLRELSCLVNVVFHFGFVADYFSYYISDYYNEMFNENKLDDFVGSFLNKTAISFKEQLLNKNNDEFTDEDNEFLIDNLQSFFNDQELELVDFLVNYFSDLAYTLEKLIQHNSIISFSDLEKEYLYLAVIYANTLSHTVEKTDDFFADNMWNLANQFLFVRFTQKQLPNKPIQFINQETELRPYGYSMSLNYSVRIYSDIKEIPEGEFLKNSRLYNIALDEGSTEIIGKKAFAFSSLSSLSLPLSTRIIGEKAFAGCSIQTLIIPPNVERIDEYAFQNCKMLKTVFVLNKDTVISKTAFEGCSPDLSISFYSNTNKITLFDDTSVKEQEKLLLDVVSPAYLIKNKNETCPICNNSLANKHCIIKYRDYYLKIQLLFCSECDSYFINSAIINKYRLQNICPTSATLSQSNVIDRINVCNMTMIPEIPKEIIIKNSISGEQFRSYQLANCNDDIIIEARPEYRSLIEQVHLNDEVINLPYTSTASKLNSIQTEIKAFYPIKLDFLTESLIVSCDGIPINNMQLLEKGKTIKISKNDDFSKNDNQGRSINKVFVNSQEVMVPYQFSVESRSVISATYNTPIYVYADKRLQLSSSECEIAKCTYDSKEFDKYKLPKFTTIDVSSASGFSVKSITYLNNKHELPAKLKIEHQSSISVNKIENCHRLKISSPYILVSRNGAFLHSGDIIREGDLISMKLSGVQPDDYFVLQNGVAITIPHTIVVKDSDINLELVSRKSINKTEQGNLISHSNNDPQLNPSSFLGDMGYSTSLGTSQRYEILQKAVKKYGKKKIISFLEYLIRGKLAQVNGASKYENAISIWRFDIQRVKSM